MIPTRCHGRSTRCWRMRPMKADRPRCAWWATLAPGSDRGFDAGAALLLTKDPEQSADAGPRPRTFAEFLGTAFLAAVVIGSGIAAQQLSPECRGTRALGECPRDRGRTRGDHLHVGRCFRRPSQPGGLHCRCLPRSDQVAGGLCLRAGPGSRVRHRGRRRESHVLRCGDHDLNEAPSVGRPLPLRAHRNHGLLS